MKGVEFELINGQKRRVTIAANANPLEELRRFLAQRGEYESEFIEVGDLGGRRQEFISRSSIVSVTTFDEDDD